MPLSTHIYTHGQGLEEQRQQVHRQRLEGVAAGSCQHAHSMARLA